MTQRVLVLCTGNSARSQMAEAYLRSLPQTNLEVHSAGVAPSTVRPEAVTVMEEIGISAADLRSKSVDEFKGQNFDYVITVCDNAAEYSRERPSEYTGLFQIRPQSRVPRKLG
jgi:arsenate reductase (thioredoxin)